MRTWRGYADDTTNIGTDPVLVDNCSLRVRGQLSRRPCLGDKISLAAQSLGALETTSGSWLAANNAGTLTSYNLGTDVSFTLKSGLASTPRGNWANAGGQLYFTNGTDAIQVISQGSAVALAAGITGPVAAPTAGSESTGVITAGVHLIRFRWKNSVTGYYSNPSDPLEYTAPGVKNLAIGLSTTADAKVDQMVIEMTLVDGETYYVVATVANSNAYTINISDAELATNQLTDVYSGPDGFGYDVPPINKLITELRGRIFLWGGKYLYWSRAGFPEAFNVLDWARDVTPGKADQPTAMVGFFNDLYLFSVHSMRRLVYTGDPAAGMIVGIAGELGAYNQRCIVLADGMMYGFCPSGAWYIDGIQPDYLSRPIDQTWMEEVDNSLSEQFHGWYDPIEQAVWFAYVATGDDFPKKCICYEVRNKQWTRRTFRNSIRASITVGDASRTTVAWLADADGGKTWKLQSNRLGDGVPTTVTSGIVTCAAGCTTTILQISGSLPTAPDYAGAILYDETNDVQRLISSNTSSAITLSTPLASAPNLGDQFYVGSVPCRVKSQWQVAEALNQTMRPARLQVDHLSDGDEVDVRVKTFINFSANANLFTKLSIADVAPQGVTLINNNSVAVVDTSVVGPTVPVNFQNAKCMAWEVVQQQPRGNFKLLDMTYQFDERSEIGKERTE